MTNVRKVCAGKEVLMEPTGGSGKAEGLVDGAPSANQTIRKLRLPLPPASNTKKCWNRRNSDGNGK
jgi:hypothetical protein